MRVWCVTPYHKPEAMCLKCYMNPVLCILEFVNVLVVLLDIIQENHYPSLSLEKKHADIAFELL